ncbi:Heparan-sulfate 6-O-sulfotransferase 2 [Heterocephalus glaber]|uniref:Heparan-sulfate 6-O-sulfotransferase n=1 Tax=Heterocephalus glaber TaxID=10181 RepID=G5BZH7_HETGA|nr:Heparan-sulfate 6-O-sulfotransferase 2 [Heterocephalus glaber]
MADHTVWDQVAEELECGVGGVELGLAGALTAKRSAGWRQGFKLLLGPHCGMARNRDTVEELHAAWLTRGEELRMEETAFVLRDYIRSRDINETILDLETVEDGLRNFHYITILRDPVSRYLSEWRHVQRGATWKASLHVCDGRPPTSKELPSCYTGDDWSGCPLKEFMDCPYNLANNRQVRMLSDLTLVGCYNLSVMPEKQRNKVLLESAKSNLKHMAFFGLTEFQRKTQYLFEKTFNMNFISPFTQYNTTRASSVEINEEVQKHIERLNFLDMELYSYAKDLFLQRYQFMRQKEHQEARRKRLEQRKFLRGRFLQTHFQGQRQGQSQNPTQNQSQNPNLNANQNLTQNLTPNLTQNLSQKENRSNQKRNPGQDQKGSNNSNGINDYIGSVEKWR